MELPEDCTNRFEDNKLPVDLQGASEGQASGFSPESGLPGELPTASGKINLSRHEWAVEVIPGQISGALNRMSFAIDLLLAAAARLR